MSVNIGWDKEVTDGPSVDPSDTVGNLAIGRIVCMTVMQNYLSCNCVDAQGSRVSVQNVNTDALGVRDRKVHDYFFIHNKRSIMKHVQHN